MKRKFTNLKQRQMTVTEYKREFIRLSKYARDMVATEADKCRRFEDGLNDYIRLQVAAFEFEDFTRLVSAALNVERIKKEEQARRDRSQQRRGSGQSSSYQPQKKLILRFRIYPPYVIFQMHLRRSFMRRWMELIKDYNCVIDYHPEKANVPYFTS
ncbi:hypothetical protein ACOSP7_004038 [Xanthoceras sorbifolium]